MEKLKPSDAISAPHKYLEAHCLNKSIVEIAKLKPVPTGGTPVRHLLLTPQQGGGKTTFDFELRGRITLVYDTTGTGKTLLRVRYAQSAGYFTDVYAYNVGGQSKGNSALPTSEKSLLLELPDLKNALIIIDEADELLGSTELRNYIERDLDNEQGTFAAQYRRNGSQYCAV